MAALIALLAAAAFAAPAADAPVPAAVLSAVGDIRLDGPVAAVAKREGPGGPTALVAGLLKADIVFGNLETPITARGAKTAKKFNFRAHPSLLPIVEAAGFTVLNIANNHVWDYGEEGFLDTLKHLRGGPWAVVGGGKNLEEAESPRVVATPSGLKVAFLGLTSTNPSEGWARRAKPGVAYSDLARIPAMVAKARAAADFVVVSFHGGTELAEVPNDIQKTVARASIDAGADLFLGHHPHCLQPVELYKGKPVVHSLGNFLFVSPSTPTYHTVIARVELEKGKTPALEFHPLEINGGQPKPAGPEAARLAFAALDRWGALSAASPELRFAPPEAP